MYNRRRGVALDLGQVQLIAMQSVRRGIDPSEILLHASATVAKGSALDEGERNQGGWGHSITQYDL